VSGPLRCELNTARLEWWMQQGPAMHPATKPCTPGHAALHVQFTARSACCVNCRHVQCSTVGPGRPLPRREVRALTSDREGRLQLAVQPHSRAAACRQPELCCPVACPRRDSQEALGLDSKPRLCACADALLAGCEQGVAGDPVHSRQQTRLLGSTAGRSRRREGQWGRRRGEGEACLCSSHCCWALPPPCQGLAPRLTCARS